MTTTKTEHTPGPWGIDRAIDIWIKAGSLHVASIPRAGDGDWSEANARLVAASPDLLAALELAVRENLRGNVYWIDAARAAIAKATA